VGEMGMRMRMSDRGGKRNLEGNERQALATSYRCAAGTG
jgi:hypothetical protein